MLKFIYRILSEILNKLKFYFSINWIKTIYFNFKMLPFSIAKKLPVLFYGKVKFTSLKGKVVITAPIRFGMVRFGINLELIKRNFNKSELRIDGSFLINGSFSTGNDCVICLTKEAFLELGEGSYLGSNTKIIVTKFVRIGKAFRFGYDSQISDSNYHYTIDLELNEVSRFNKEIVIGDYCWIGNRTSIMKGTITPSNLIVASNSLLNKNYLLNIPQNSVIGGIPAKLLKKNLVRVYDSNLELEVSKYFNENSDKNEYILK